MTKSSVLWKLEGENILPSYLFGTIHLPVLSRPWREEAVKTLIPECSVFVAEMDLSQSPSAKYHDYHLLPEGKVIADYMSLKQYHKLSSQLRKAFALNLEDYRYLRPLLVNHIIDRSIVKGTGSPMDQHLWNFAIEAGKEVIGLESLDDQIVIFHKLPLDFQINILSKIGRNVGKYRKKIMKLVDNYMREDIDQLYRSSKSSMGAYRKMMIYDRNRIMSNRMEDIVREKKAFITMGAGHLAGNKGVIASLKRKGYQLTPLLTDKWRER